MNGGDLLRGGGGGCFDGGTAVRFAGMVAVISHSDGLLHFPIPILLLLFHTLMLLTLWTVLAGCGRLLLFVGGGSGNCSAVLGFLGCNGNKR